MQHLYQIFGVNNQDATERDTFYAAMKDGMQVIFPTAPATMIWAVVTAVAMVAAGMSPTYVLLTNLFVYAASAQLTVLSMLILHAPLPIIWLAAAVVNLRFVIFSAALKPYFRHLKLSQRMLYGFLNGDINSMLFNFRYRNQTAGPATNEHKGFFLGMALVNFSAWQIGCVIGVLFASVIPATWGLELAAALTLLVLIIKGVEHWAGVAGCAVAAVTAVLLQSMPYKLWVLVAIIAGVAVALIIETVFPNGYLKSKKVAPIEEGV